MTDHNSDEERAKRLAAIEAARDLIDPEAYNQALRDLGAAPTAEQEAQAIADRAEITSEIRAGRAALEGAEVINLQEVKAKGGRKKKTADGTPPPDDAPTKPKLYKTVFRPRITPEGELTYVPATFLAKDCPIQPLGMDNNVFWFLNAFGQLCAMEASKMGQAHLMGLFAGRLNWLNREFPQLSQHGTWKGFAAQYAQMALTEACAKKDLFDPRDKVRGRGCWKDRQGRLVQHLGDLLLIAGEQPHRPGELGDYVYPGRPKVERPNSRPEAIEKATEVLRTFETWRFARGAIDARLLMGWIGCAILGAALDWRPMTFVTGDAGTGKSTLLNRIKAMLPGRLVSTIDATPAALRQIINQDSVGVLFDEVEADVLNDSAQNVMKLARIAASGGTTYRGGKDHNAAEFTLRGCFMFSAIVPPSMRGADMQRMAFLRLQPLPVGQKLNELTPAEAESYGAAIAGRITEGFSRWSQTLQVHKNALIRKGHNERSAMQFGSLLAAADLILEDEALELDDERSDKWADLFAEKLPKGDLFEYENNAPEWLKAWHRILQFQPDAWRGSGSPTVAQVLRKMVKAPKGSDDWASGANKLERAGLAVVVDQKNGHQFLAIPPRHPAVTKIFAGTDLQAHGGDGAWSTVMRNAPAYTLEGGVYRVAPVPRLQRVKCTQYWLDAIYEGEPIFARELEDDAQIMNDCDGKL